MFLRLPAKGRFRGIGGLDRSALGIPTEAEFVERYCKRTGLGDIPQWTFYLVFSYFRIAAILQGVMKRALDGNASSEEALAYGAMAGPLARSAVALIDETP